MMASNVNSIARPLPQEIKGHLSMLFAKTNQLTNSRQQGLALIMSLVILLVLTLLGITAMNTANLQLLMTGNSQYQTTALNTAESIIRTAEDVVNGVVAGGTPPTTGYYDIRPSQDTAVDLASFNWADSSVVMSGTSKYIIEYAGNQVLDSASKKWRQNEGISGDTVSVFRITARSPATRGAVRYVQSIYVTIDSPV